MRDSVPRTPEFPDGIVHDILLLLYLRVNARESLTGKSQTIAGEPSAEERVVLKWLGNAICELRVVQDIGVSTTTIRRRNVVLISSLCSIARNSIRPHSLGEQGPNTL